MVKADTSYIVPWLVLLMINGIVIGVGGWCCWCVMRPNKRMSGYQNFVKWWGFMRNDGMMSHGKPRYFGGKSQNFNDANKQIKERDALCAKA